MSGFNYSKWDNLDCSSSEDENENITGKTVIDISAINENPDIFSTLYGVDLNSEKELWKIQRHMGDIFYIYQ